MPRYILKIHDDKFNKDYYMEWSTVVDAPVTYGMSLDEFNAYYKEQYGLKGMEELKERMQRVEENGTSAHYETLQSFFDFNRAGPKEGRLGKEGILRDYCRPETVKS